MHCAIFPFLEEIQFFSAHCCAILPGNGVVGLVDGGCRLCQTRILRIWHFREEILQRFPFLLIFFSHDVYVDIKLSNGDLILTLLEWNRDDGSSPFFILDFEQLSSCILSCHFHLLHSEREMMNIEHSSNYNLRHECSTPTSQELE